MDIDARAATIATDLLALARVVEQSVPDDLPRARAGLRLLGEALAGHEGSHQLRALLARIEHDLDGGRVRAVTGLTRQVRSYQRCVCPPSSMIV